MNRIEQIERICLRAINKLVYHGRRAPKKIQLISGGDLNEHIYSALIGEKPFMVARFGSVELDATLYTYLCHLPLFERYKLYIQKKIPFVRVSEYAAQNIIEPLCNNAGFFPNDISLIKEYGKRVCELDAPYCDYLCCSEWINEDLAKPFLDSNIRYASINDMEPYDYVKPWSRALAGKKVLVVHPFADTIKKQYLKREQLWENKDVLPEFELHTIKAVQSIAGEEVPFKDWFEALHHMEEQMDAIDYDIAILGCGAYGFSLAAHAKRMGKKAVHLGGATQILFGIKGKRWDEIPAVSKFYNEHWVYPSKEDTPKHKERVENGCYW